jgi:hypothetical protein
MMNDGPPLAARRHTMQYEQVVSVGTVSERHYLIELKTWLEEARDMLIPAIQRVENELQRIPLLESTFGETEAPATVTEGLTSIRVGMQACLEILRDQDSRWIKGINSVEKLVRISEGWEASGELSVKQCTIEFKSWLEGALETLMPAVQRADNELQRIRRIEAEFSKIETLSLITQRLTKIRSGMVECLEILRDQNVEWMSRITWIENVAGITAVWQVSSELVGLETEPPSKPLIPAFGVETLHPGEPLRIGERNSMTAALSRTFSEHSLLTFIFFTLSIVLITGSLSYLIANHSRLEDLHQYIYTLKNDLSTSRSVNKNLSTKNSDLNYSIAAMEGYFNKVKEKNSELKLNLQAEHLMLTQSKHDLAAIKATNHRMRSEVNSKLSDIANAQTELKGALYLSEMSKATSDRSLILNPVWFQPGESVRILDGRFTMRIEQTPGQNPRSGIVFQVSPVRKGFTGKRFHKTFRPRVGIPENFRAGYHKCAFVLLGSKTNNDGTKAYLIAVLRK